MKQCTRLLSRAATRITALAVGLAGPAVLVAAPAEAALKEIGTPFAYQGSAYGTRVTLGDSQGALGSGRTAWAILGCTTTAPLRFAEHGNAGRVNANDMIQVGAVTSVTGTYRAPAQDLFGSRSTNGVADIVLGQDGGPQVTIEALRTTADAFNRGGRYGARTGIDLTGIGLTGVTSTGSETPGPLEDLIDAVDRGLDDAAEQVLAEAGRIDIPEVGTVYLQGKQRSPVGDRSAVANAFGVRIELDNGSEVNIGRAWSKIVRANPAGVFSGRSYATEATALSDVVSLGRYALQPLRCTGTGGQWQHNELAGLTIPGMLEVGAADSSVYGKGYRDGRAVARTASSIDRVVLQDGAVVIDGIRAQANVLQNARGAIRALTIDGTSLGALSGTAVDEGQAMPEPGGEPLEIPGVGTIETGLVVKTARSVRVTALRITLDDGSGAVLDIGNARTKILRR